MRHDALPEAEPHPSALQLQALVDGEAGPAEQLVLARHVEGCANCRQRRGRVQELHSRLSALPLAEEPEGFTSRVMQSVRACAPPRRAPAALRLVVPSALVLVSVLSALSGPISSRLLVGIGRVLRLGPVDPRALAEAVIGGLAAMLGGLGRAVEWLAPHAPSLPSAPSVEIWIPVLAGMLMTGLVLMGMMLMVAVAGHGLLRRTTRRSID